MVHCFGRIPLYSTLDDLDLEYQTDKVSDSQLSSIIPQESSRAAEKLIIETCHNELSNCPNVLIPTAKWDHALLKWAEEVDISKRLRQRVKSKKIVHLYSIRII